MSLLSIVSIFFMQSFVQNLQIHLATNIPKLKKLVLRDEISFCFKNHVGFFVHNYRIN